MSRVTETGHATQTGWGSAAQVQDAVRDMFMRVPFDFAFTAYYPATTIGTYHLTTAERTLRFTVKQLEKAGYRGYYAIAVHDKRGSTLWHPHLALDGRKGQAERVRHEFRPIADINCNRNGRIERLDAWCGYIAMRACERGYSDETWETGWLGDAKPKRMRGSRGRGHGHGAFPVSDSSGAGDR